MTDFYKQFTSMTNSPAWLNIIRQQAFATFETKGLPTLRDEGWKYTNIKPIEKRQFHFQQNMASIDTTAIKSLFIPQLDCHRIIFIDGVFYSYQSDDNTKNLSIKNLATAIKENIDEVKNHLSHYSQKISHGFAALNTALIHEGAYIKIGKNAVIKKPIHLLYIASENDRVSYPRNLIIAEKNSSATLIENYVSLNANNYFTNAITEIILHPSAKLTHLKIQSENAQAFHIASTQVQQLADSQFISNALSFGAAIGRSDIYVELAAKGAECHLNGLYCPQGKQHMDHHTFIDHLAPHCTSREFYKGILTDFSHAVFNGQVYVHPGAHHTDANQTNKNLLLSDKAEIDTKPQLEIYNDDVKCSHGATVGQLDESALFYLRTRGLTKSMAESVLTYAFANELVESIEIKAIKQQIKHLILQRLPAGKAMLELLL